jgi:hypothetical protein
MSNSAKAVMTQSPMNKTEERYAWVLEGRKQAGEIQRYEFEKITLKLGDDCRYTPDFYVVNRESEVEFHEVKGFFRDDAKVKIKVAAEMFPFRFFLAQVVKGGWDVKEIQRA